MLAPLRRTLGTQPFIGSNDPLYQLTLTETHIWDFPDG